MAFDQSGPRWLGISDLIAEPEGPTFISYKVARSRLNRLRFVTQDPTAEVVPAMSGDAPWAAHGRGDARATCHRVLPATEPVFRETLLRQITAGVESL